MAIEVRKIKHSKISKVDFAGLGFGDIFSDHMLKMAYGKGRWGDEVNVWIYQPHDFANTASVVADHNNISNLDHISKITH